MNKFFLLSCTLLVLLSGCKLFDAHKTKDKPIVEQPPKEKAVITPFTKDTLYSLMVAEFAEHRGQFAITLKNYVEQAHKTKDPKVIERAYQIASYLEAPDKQLDMAQLWVKVSPNNINANQAIAIQLTQHKRSNEASPFFEKILANTDQLDFLNLANNSLTPKARQELIISLDKLLINHPNNAQLIYTKTILLAENGNHEQALSTLQKLSTEQQNTPVILLKVYLLQNLGRPDEAIAFLNKAVNAAPDDKKLRLNYAHLLIAQGKLTEAKQQFIELINQYPDDQELPFALAIIYLENKEWDAAISQLQQIIANGIDSDAIYFYLASAYNGKGDKDTALINYQLITGGENYLPALANSSKILFEKNKIKEGQLLLTNARKKQPELAIPLYLFEVEELLKLNKTNLAWQTVNQALRENTNNTSLLYSRALVAEKRNDLKQTEQDLRKVIKLEPENASAINALGYILADKTTRYKEASALIQQALKLNPDDPAILDSLGWVNYRLGNLPEAVKYLQKAYSNYPEPEVASHLGEVLWQQGNHQQAKAIWSKSLTDNPQNQTLQQTILRLTGAKEL